MSINRGRFRTISLVILLLHACAIGAFLIARSPLRADQWASLEGQRPRVNVTSSGVSGSFVLVADGLDFALARRQIGGGWESAPVRLFAIVNLPSYLVSLATFQLLQAKPGGTAKLHSDLATAMFAAIAFIQWCLVALLLSMRRART